MAGKKYYAVRNGKNIGIYSTWEECKEQVSGFSGAEYKGFTTIEEANNYLAMAKNNDIISHSDSSSKIKELYPTDVAVAYVDGSFKEETSMYGSGVIILYDGEELEFASCGNDPNLVGMRNVAGEIVAAEMAIQWCLSNDVKKLVIHYDYKGIADWCTEIWEATKPGTKAYKALYDEASKKIEISFVKVKGHSGDKYNDIADGLAGSML